MPSRVMSFVIVAAAFAAGCGRSPVSFAEGISGLDIPTDAAVISFVEEDYGSDSGDLFARAEFSLDEEGFASLAGQAEALGYERIGASDGDLPDQVGPSGMSMHGFAEAAAEMTGPQPGLFRYTRDQENSFTLVVLDPGGSRLVVLAVTI